jgi:DNA polymerase V
LPVPEEVKFFSMDGEQFFGAAYKGSKNFSQQEVKTANATGFGAAADDYAERGIDLNEQLIKNKPATFFFRMKGDAMREAGMFDNDILIVDRSLKLASGKIIVAVLNGELLVRRFHKNFSSAFLIPENPRYKSINLAEFSDFQLWGVVVYSIHSLG